MTPDPGPEAGRDPDRSGWSADQRTSARYGSDGGLLAELRVMWQDRDPMPAGLVAAVLTSIAALDLDEEYELLVLVEATQRLAGVRGAAEARTFTFSSEQVTVMLRVSDLADGRRRLDGWISPPAVLDIQVSCAGSQWHTTSTGNGRFELADIPAGTATVRLRSPAAQGQAPVGEVDVRESGSAQVDVGGGPVRLATPPFQV